VWKCRTSLFSHFLHISDFSLKSTIIISFFPFLTFYSCCLCFLVLRLQRENKMADIRYCEELKTKNSHEFKLFLIKLYGSQIKNLESLFKKNDTFLYFLNYFHGVALNHTYKIKNVYTSWTICH